jgi:hypothetical protein
MEMPSGWRSSEHQRQCAKHRRHRRHQDRAEAQQAGLIDRLPGRFSFVAFGVECKVDHHDRVLLHDADEENDADDRDDGEIVAGHHQRQQRADTGRWQRRQNREGVNEALIEHAQHDVDGDDRRQNQEELIGKRRLKRERSALEAGDHAGGQGDVDLRLLDRLDRVAESSARRKVERHRGRRELPEMRDLQRRGFLAEFGERCEWHRGAADR